MSQIDYSFVVDSLYKYQSHLDRVIKSIEENIKTYDRQEAELTRLVEFKPAQYTKELEKVQGKKREADIKLSHLVPRMQKIGVQILTIEKEQGLPNTPVAPDYN